MSTTYTLKLISWNVRARVKEAVLRQVEALRNQQPQIVALQDVNMNSVQLYQKYFERIGLPHIAHTFQSHPEKSPSGVLIASCFELDPFPTAQSSKIWPTGTYSPDNDIVVKHWNKRTLFVTLNSTWGKIDLYHVHITAAEHKEVTSRGKIDYPTIKLDLLAGLYQVLSKESTRPRILCGDFNTPQEEKADGEIITWGYDLRDGKYALTRLDQHEVELRILRDLASYDLPDIYRSIHGYENNGSEEAWSWQWHERGYKRRYDHVFASKTLHPKDAKYLQDIRRLKLSDHTPIEVVFELTNSVKI